MTPEPTLEQRANVPVPAILTLWSLGHSATDIAKRLGIRKSRTVSLIVEQARDIGDPRAVLHVGKNGRPVGRPNKALDPGVEVVPAIPASKCCRGHLKTADSIDRQGNCRKCRQRTCRRGHRLTKQNTIINASGPQCRKCKNIIHQRSRARIRAQQAAMECRSVL